MIGTFWNLCRACPAMPVEKICLNSRHGKPDMIKSSGTEVHSEYRSTYRWHEYSEQVIRKPPQPVSGNKEDEDKKRLENAIEAVSAGGGLEPALPRRKKNPSLAYKTHDLLTRPNSKERESASLDRARCGERDGERASRRSKSEGPPTSPPAVSRVLRSDSDPFQFAQDLMKTIPLEGGALKNAISRISTEYRLQFAWPRGKRGTEEETTAPPRKSLSMGAIKPTATQQQAATQQTPAPVHKKRITQADKIAGTAELEPLFSNQEDYVAEEKMVQETLSKDEKSQLSGDGEFKTEYKKKFRPFSQYDYIEGKFKPKKEQETEMIDEKEIDQAESWFREVIELRKKAGQYKHRGWGTELVPEHIAELYTKQMELWEQVSRRSSLSALSLASSAHPPLHKDQVDNKESSPTKHYPSHHLGKSDEKEDKLEHFKRDFGGRSRMDHFIRHHLERTTGVGDEGILHSPTREKLEPVIIRRKDIAPDISRSPQKVQTYSGRSQSAGAKTATERSPKRATRSQHPPKAPSSDKTQRPREKGVEELEKSEEEPVVKSPPEPTRVKSPDQVLIRSPEPVNWTVPLDTGKTFTVTQNVNQGDIVWRAQSESRMRSESAEAPPPPPQSAPPALTETTEWSKEGEEKKYLEAPLTSAALKCLDDPSFTFDTNSHEQKPLSDVLEKAHTRFDQFWGRSNQEKLDNQGEA